MKKNVKKFLATGVAATLVATGSQVVAAPAAQAAPNVQVTANLNGFRVEPWMLGIGAAAGIAAIIALLSGILGNGNAGGSSFDDLLAGSDDLGLPGQDDKPGAEENVEGFRAELLKELEAWRSANAPGAKDLTFDASLNAGAQEWAEHLADIGELKHPEDGNFIENAWWGTYSPSAEQVTGAWEDSPGHRANMANTSITKVGFGVAKASNGSYYVVFRGQ